MTRLEEWIAGARKLPGAVIEYLPDGSVRVTWCSKGEVLRFSESVSASGEMIRTSTELMRSV